MAIQRTDPIASRRLAAIDSTRAITPLGDIRQENIERLGRLEVGKQFQAQILSRFNDGTFLVRIADTSARLALPGGGKVGEGLALTLLGTDPRPTFSLDGRSAVMQLSTNAAASDPSLAPGARLAQALYLSNSASAAAGSAGSAGAADTGAAPATLSPAGKLIADLLGAARNGAAATALVGNTPLAGLAGAPAPQLASALQQTLTYSGLFYESHVQQWANGERPLTDLLREPQARGSTASPGAAAAMRLTDLPPDVVENRRNLLDYFGAAPLQSAGPASGAAGMDPAAAQMVGLQLQTLEQQRVHWHGELWPGQAMEWEVRRSDDEASGSRLDASGSDREQWQSVVRFSLPSLGIVAATIDLRGDRVQIQVRTASDSTAAALRLHGARLAGALEAAGSPLDALTIRREAPDDGFD